jgi:YidC/Oxa1 family membrane protein insertase
MELWHAWTGLLQQMLQTLATDWGLGVGLAIIVLTLAMRTALVPLAWSLALRAATRQAKLAKLQPYLQAIREQHATDRQAQMQKTLDLYHQHGLSMADGKSLLGAIVQMPLVCGLYQTLRDGVGTAAFVWVRNLGRPDAILALLAAVTTAAAMAVAPQMSEQMRLVIILLPAVFCLLAALHFSSGIALYWITSNVFGTVQTLALRRAMKRRSGLG